MPNLDELLKRLRLTQQQQLKATIEARQESAKPTMRIGDRLPTGQFEVIHPSGSVTSNGVKIFNASYSPGQVVRGTQAQGQPTIALDWKNVQKKPLPERVEPLPETAVSRILAFGDYYGFADPAYTNFPGNRTFALNMFKWLGSGRKRIATFSTASLASIGGDISIDAPEFSGLQADLTSAGYTINAIDIVSGDLEAALASADIFFVPLIIDDADQLDTAQATLLADFARQKKGVVMVSGWQTNENYTGLYEVFGVLPISSSGVVAPPVDPIPASLKTLLTGVTNYTTDSGEGQGGLIYADPASGHTFTELFDLFLSDGFNLGFSIELADP